MKTARLPKEGRFFYVQALPMVLPISTKCSEEFFFINIFPIIHGGECYDIRHYKKRRRTGTY